MEKVAINHRCCFLMKFSMKLRFIIWLPLFASLTFAIMDCKAQVDSSFVTFIEKQVRGYQRTRTIHCADRLTKEEIKLCIKASSKEKIVSSFRTPTIDSILLTKKERIKVRKGLRSQQAFIWPDSLFEDSKRIHHDSLLKYVNTLNRHVFDSLKSDSAKLTQYFKGYFTYYSFLFSKPIYLRNNSIFLIQFVWLTGTGGFHEMAFYRKTENSWKKWIVFNHGDF